MILEFDKSFSKSLDKITENVVKEKLKNIITEIDNATTFRQIKNIKKLVGFQNYYRIRVGNYRIGFELRNNSTIRFIIISHRKDIYKKFP